MGRFACVIFDVDGTLTDTNDLIFESFNHVAEKYLGRRLAWSEITALFGPPEEGALARVFPPALVAPALDDLCRFYQQHHATLANLHPGIDQALTLLRRKGIPLAVFTGKGRRTAGITLQVLGIDQYFDLVVSGDDVARHKPAPEGIQRILEAFNVPAASTLMVGDAMGDLVAARAIGVSIASVLWDSYECDRVRAAQPDYLFETVQEFVDWIPRQV